jgi:diaminopimelate epimerase
VILPFTKMHGAGNDFVVIDHRSPFLPADADALFARLCDRRRGIGADGVLLLEASSTHDFTMRYHNSDGGRASFCGNGARCLARFALSRGLGAEGRVRFMTDAGPKSAEPRPGGLIALHFGPIAPGRAITLEAAGRSFSGRHLVAGVPHLVLPVEGIEAIPFAEWSPPLRAHVALGEAGANVDYVERRADGRVAMRTWERGVEGETLACGSGAMASALWAMLDAGLAPPVTIRTAGGDDLVIEAEAGPDGHDVTLVGPAVKVYDGEWQEP